MCLLELRGVTKTFRRRVVLDSVSFSVSSGECFVLLGPSGSGKTTILRVIAGLERPDSGSVIVERRDITPVPPSDRGVTLVFQDLALWPHMTVDGHLRFVLGPHLRSRKARQHRATEVLELVGLTGRGSALPHELSGGEQQRLALARAIAAPQKLLLLDEPWSNLDPPLRRDLRAELSQIVADLSLTVVQATHDHREALESADRIAVLHDGRLEQIGHPTEVVRAPATPFVERFVEHSE